MLRARMGPVATGFFVVGALVVLSTTGPGRGKDDAVEDAVISPDGKYFAKSTFQGTTIYEIQTGKVKTQLQAAALARLRFSADSKYLATGQLTELTLWDVKKGKPIGVWKGTNRRWFRIDFAQDGSKLAACDDKSLRVWDVTTQKLLLTIALPYETASLALSCDGTMMAVGGTEAKAEEPRYHEIKIWQIPSGKLQAVLKGPYCIVKSLAFSPDGNYLASGLSNQMSQFWDLRKQKELWRQNVRNVDHGILAFSRDGKELFVGGYHSITVLDATSGTAIKTQDVRGGPITSFTAAAKPGYLLFSQKQGIQSIDLASGQQRVVFPK